jgi:hypothetical protein
MQAKRASTWIGCSMLQMCMCVQMAPQESGHLWASSELQSRGKPNRRRAKQNAQQKAKRAMIAAAEASADTGSTSVLASYEEASFKSHHHHGSAHVTTEVCKN